MKNLNLNLEVAIRHYIANNDNIVKDMIAQDDNIRTGILNWLKEMEQFIGTDIYGTRDYLKCIGFGEYDPMNGSCHYCEDLTPNLYNACRNNKCDKLQTFLKNK